MESMFVPNFMKIERGEDFFFVDLAWNDPDATVAMLIV